MGPVIDNDSAHHLQDQWVDLMMKGGKPIRRLDRPDEKLPFLTPALIDVTDVKDRADEELFGPVLQMIRVKDFDAAIAEANNTRFGLSASLVGGTPAMYYEFWSQVRAGVITGTSRQWRAVSAPFGGIGYATTTGQAPFMRPTIAPIRSPQRGGMARASISEGLKDPDLRRLGASSGDRRA